jgi:hypothetical protein
MKGNLHRDSSDQVPQDKAATEANLSPVPRTVKGSAGSHSHTVISTGQSPVLRLTPEQESQPDFVYT